MLTTLAAQWHPGGWNGGAGEAPAFWPVFPIMFGLFWLVVAAAGFYVMRRRMTKGGAPGHADPLGPARTILAERFARGEIEEDEYLMRMSALRTDA